MLKWLPTPPPARGAGAYHQPAMLHVCCSAAVLTAFMLLPSPRTASTLLKATVTSSNDPTRPLDIKSLYFLLVLKLQDPFNFYTPLRELILPPKLLYLTKDCLLG